jgi:hypothetical protein
VKASLSASVCNQTPQDEKEIRGRREGGAELLAAFCKAWKTICQCKQREEAVAKLVLIDS